jgi:hypothetical protein
MLSPMAKGIQALHSTVELFNRYALPEIPTGLDYDEDAINKEDILFNWSRNHKTCISLNAGTSPDLHVLRDFLDNPENPYPWAEFHEDDSLGGLMTAISVVLPEKIYKASEILRTSRGSFFTTEGWLYYNETISGLEYTTTVKEYDEYSEYEQLLALQMNSYRLASV